MSRFLLCALLATLLVPTALRAAVACDELGIGIEFGMTQPSGGDNDYSDSGLNVGFRASKPLADKVCIAFDYRHAETRNKPIDDVIERGRFASWGVPDEFRTVWNTATLSAVFNIAAQERFRPFVSAGLGVTFWETQDWRDDQGDVPDGYNDDGQLRRLKGENLTGVLGAGVEIFASETFAVGIGGRYNYLLQQHLDTSGLSVVGGPDYTDADSALLEGYVSLNYYFGPGDCDGDGLIGDADKCWRQPEDFDGFEDEDGCPDPDNDADGILDADDLCPNVPEDFNGIEDEDGCPDADTDGDGVIDLRDECPGTPMGTPVDEKGCPKPEPPKPVSVAPAPEPPKPQLVAVTVDFPLNSTVLDGTDKEKLDALAVAMGGDPDLMVRVSGHACDLGSDEYNQRLSDRRAAAVKAYLVDKGVAATRVMTVGVGETQPIVPNTSELNREQNRVAIIEAVR